MLEVAVDAKPGDTSGKVPEEAISKTAQPFGFIRHLGGGDGRRLSEPDAERRWQSSRTQASFLSATIDQRQQAHARPTPDVERADPLGPVDLVTRNRQQVDLHRPNIERDLPEGLRCV